jgi:hypothetical protein
MSIVVVRYLFVGLSLLALACKPSGLGHAEDALQGKEYSEALSELDKAPTEGSYALERDRLVLESLKGLISSGNGADVLAYFRNDRRSGPAIRAQMEKFAGAVEDGRIGNRLAVGDWQGALGLADDPNTVLTPEKREEWRTKARDLGDVGARSGRRGRYCA